MRWALATVAITCGGNERHLVTEAAASERIVGMDLDALAVDAFVERPRLIRRLNGSAAPLVLLDAPTGYGKTVLLTQWATVDQRPFAWVTLADEHNDPAALVAAVLDAIEEIDPLPPEIRAALASPEPDLERTLVPRLERGMSGRRAPLVLVLDELEHIFSPQSLRVIRALVERIPAGSQVALSTRATSYSGLYSAV